MAGAGTGTLAAGLLLGEVAQPAMTNSATVSATITLERFVIGNTGYVVAISGGRPCIGPAGVYCLVDDVLG